MRVTGCARTDVSVLTCLIVVTVARIAAIPNAALRAIRAQRACMESLPSKQSKALNVRPQRRHFAVEPVLLLGERHPGLRHAHVAFERGLAFGSFRKLAAVLGVFPEDV